MIIKKLFSIIAFISTSLALAKDLKYPILSHQMSSKSYIPAICENNEKRWLPDKNIAKSCENLNGFFPLMVERLKNSKFTTVGESLVFEKRQLLLEVIRTADFMTLLYKDVYPIFKGQSMTAEARNQEMDYVLEYILKVAEEENPKKI